MDFFNCIKASQVNTKEANQPKCKSKDQKMNQTSRNTFLNQSFSKNNNTTGRIQYYPRLPNLYQESAKRNSNEYLSDYTKAIVLCEDYFVQNKMEMNNTEEYKWKLMNKLKAVFRASYRLALFKEIENYIDFCLMKEMTNRQNTTLPKDDYINKHNLNNQLHSLKEDVASMYNNNQYNGMKPVARPTTNANNDVNAKHNKKNINAKSKLRLNNNTINNNFDKGNKSNNINNEIDEEKGSEYQNNISFDNDCFFRETNSTHLDNKHPIHVSKKNLKIKYEQMDYIKKLLENTEKKPKRKQRSNASLQKNLQNNNSLVSSIYDDNNKSDCSFQLNSNNRAINKSNASLNLSESSLIAHQNSKPNLNNTITAKRNQLTQQSKQVGVHLSNSSSAHLITNNNCKLNATNQLNQTEWDNSIHYSLMQKQVSNLSLKPKSYMKYQYQPINLNKHPAKSSIKKSHNCLKKNSSCSNYQQVPKPKKGKKISLIKLNSKQSNNQSNTNQEGMGFIKNSSRFQFDLSCYRKLTETKKKMTLKHIVLYFSLRLKINSLLLILLKTSSVYNRNIKRRTKPLKHAHTHSLSLISPITKNSYHSPYRKVILPIPSFTKGNQPNGKVYSVNESYSIKWHPTFK